MRWTLKPNPEKSRVQQLAVALGVDLPIARLLVQRGIENFDQAKDFFRPQLRDLHDPFLMKDMDKAVARIQRALSNKERILVYGDYDVDGTTSVALLASYLEGKTSEITTYIPDRFTEGYGVCSPLSTATFHGLRAAPTQQVFPAIHRASRVFSCRQLRA